MNRRKKAKQIFNKKLKKARAKLQPENQKDAKPKYISKADRINQEAPLEAQHTEDKEF